MDCVEVPIGKMANGLMMKASKPWTNVHWNVKKGQDVQVFLLYFWKKKYFEKIFIKSFNLGFDMTPNEDFKGKQRCILHGHGDIQVATATSLQDSRCYRMIGKKALPPGTKAPPKATSKAAGTGTPTKASKVKTR